MGLMGKRQVVAATAMAKARASARRWVARLVVMRGPRTLALHQLRRTARLDSAFQLRAARRR